MNYVVSDIHGCLPSLKKLLEKAGFDEGKDKLYILGDIVDRGPQIWETYEWVKERIGKSVYMILGNHEDMLIADVFTLKGYLLKEQKVKPRNDAEKKYLEYCRKNMVVYDQYMTIRHLLGEGHSVDELVEMCEFFDKLPIYYELEVGDKKYTLVHAFVEDDNHTTKRQDAVWDRRLAQEADFFCEGKTVIYGHTPTVYVEDVVSKDGKSEKINIDCGCVYKNKLALMRLEDKNIWYQCYLEG